MIRAARLPRISAAFFTLVFLVVSACGTGQTPLDAMVSGSRSVRGDAVVQRYAGNSIRFARSANGPIDREMYFAKNGSVQVVDLDREIVQDGTWRVHPSAGNVIFSLATSGIENGQAFRTGASNVTMFVNVLPDGTASVFTRSVEGAGVVTQPKPTPGFKNRARYDALTRKINAALGT